MSGNLTSQASKVLALSNDAARSFNHTYVGTEHILLALIDGTSTELSQVIANFGIDADMIRAEVDRLVSRGLQPVKLSTLPLTPRAAQVIECARQESLFMNEKCVGPEHLFLGLVNDQSGVAFKVLLNLGIRPAELRKEVFHVRLALMKLVERAVRPVRASTPRKRRMREELLSHLTAIYDQELARIHDSGAALKIVVERFGDPADLARELQSALPSQERVSFFVERFFQYRAPESAARYSFRMAVHSFVALAVVLSTVSFALLLRFGWIPEVKTLSRVFAAIIFATPPAQFVVWLGYIKMRDAIWGVFGSPKSPMRVIAIDALLAAVATIYLLAITAVTRLGGFDALRDVLWTCSWMSLLAAAGLLMLARMSGPSEIRDTLWAFVDVEA